MHDTDLFSTPPTDSAALVYDEWYIRGFSDAYCALPALIPDGPAGNEYSKGYIGGLAAVQRMIFNYVMLFP